MIIDYIEKGDDENLTNTSDMCCNEAVWELRRLEEKLFMWKEVRMNTIMQLRSIADYMDSVGHQTSMAQVVGAGGGVLASGLTVVGGVSSASAFGWSWVESGLRTDWGGCGHHQEGLVLQADGPGGCSHRGGHCRHQ